MLQILTQVAKGRKPGGNAEHDGMEAVYGRSGQYPCFDRIVTAHGVGDHGGIGRAEHSAASPGSSLFILEIYWRPDEGTSHQARPHAASPSPSAGLSNARPRAKPKETS